MKIVVFSKMYWSDWEKPAEIAVSYMDGSNGESFVTSDLHWPNGLTIDFPNERLYWTDAKKMSIESIRLDGTGRKVRPTRNSIQKQFRN